MQTAATTSDTIEQTLGLADILLEPGYRPPPIALPSPRTIRGEQLPPFVKDGLHPSVAEAHTATRAWCRSIRQRTPAYWLTLFGSSGCGKTFLARHARSYLRNHGIDCQLWNWGTAFARLNEPGSELTTHLIHLPALIIDDIGTGYTLSEKSAELHATRLYEILEARIHKHTLLTTNLSPQQIRERLDARIASRLFRGQNTIIDLTHAEDYSYLQYLKNKHNNHTT